MIFVRFDCGCVGIPDVLDGKALVVRACDSDTGPSECFFLRDVSGKRFVPIDDADYTRKLIYNISMLIGLGERFLDLRGMITGAIPQLHRLTGKE